MSDYGNLMGVQLPGALGDSSAYNIDGSCFVSHDVESLLCGKFVHIKSNHEGYKEVSDRFEKPNMIPYGVAFRSCYDAAPNGDGYMAYSSGDPINIASNGRAWVLTQTIQAAPMPLAEVYVTQDGMATQDTSAIEASGWTFTGGWEKFNGIFWIVEVQLKQGSTFLAFKGRKLVNGCVLEASLPSPQSNIKVIDITATVSPKDADNPIGEFSISDESIATIVESGDNEAMVIPTGKKAGKVYIHWGAKDGSGVQASIPFEFTA
jgi:hypothetical protein